MEDEGLQHVILGILTVIEQCLNSEELYWVVNHLPEADTTTLSSTNLTNFGRIQDGFIQSMFNVDQVNTPIIIQMQKILLGGFSQVLSYTVGIFKSEDRMGVVDDAFEALLISLFHLAQLLQGLPEFQEA